MNKLNQAILSLGDQFSMVITVVIAVTAKLLIHRLSLEVVDLLPDLVFTFLALAAPVFLQGVMGYAQELAFSVNSNIRRVTVAARLLKEVGQALGGSATWSVNLDKALVEELTTWVMYLLRGQRVKSTHLSSVLGEAATTLEGDRFAILAGYRADLTSAMEETEERLERDLPGIQPGSLLILLTALVVATVLESFSNLLLATVSVGIIAGMSSRWYYTIVDADDQIGLLRGQTKPDFTSLFAVLEELGAHKEVGTIVAALRQQSNRGVEKNQWRVKAITFLQEKVAPMAVGLAIMVATFWGLNKLAPPTNSFLEHEGLAILLLGFGVATLAIERELGRWCIVGGSILVVIFPLYHIAPLLANVLLGGGMVIALFVQFFRGVADGLARASRRRW